jgi:hypothetical protein
MEFPGSIRRGEGREWKTGGKICPGERTEDPEEKKSRDRGGSRDCPAPGAGEGESSGNSKTGKPGRRRTPGKRSRAFERMVGSGLPGAYGILRTGNSAALPLRLLTAGFMVFFQNETADQEKDDAEQNPKYGQNGEIEDEKQQPQYQKNCGHGNGRHFFGEQFFGHEKLLSVGSPFRFGTWSRLHFEKIHTHFDEKWKSGPWGETCILPLFGT